MKTPDLHSRFIDSLKVDIVTHSPIDRKPLELTIKMCGEKKFRVYLYNAGCPPGGRPNGEYKIVLTVNQPAGERGNFDHSGGFLVLLVGYIEEYDVFVLWDATKHVDFAFNKNLQVRFDTIMSAFRNGIAYQDRNTLHGNETVIAVTSKHLSKAINQRIELMIKDMIEG